MAVCASLALCGDTLNVGKFSGTVAGGCFKLCMIVTSVELYRCLTSLLILT